MFLRLRQRFREAVDNRLHHWLPADLVFALKNILMVNGLWLAGYGERETYVADRHAIHVLEIIARRVFDDV